MHPHAGHSLRKVLPFPNSPPPPSKKTRIMITIITHAKFKLPARFDASANPNDAEGRKLVDKFAFLDQELLWLCLGLGLAE